MFIFDLHECECGSAVILEPHEEDVLFAMFDNRLIAHNYTGIEKVCSIIKWVQIAQKHGIKKRCAKVLRHLASKGYVNFHGKAGNVASLSKLGVAYVLGKQANKNKENQLRLLK